ncbi:C2H2-type zinc finger protein [Candidatus Aenigmatarchaeota archaeon]
MVVKCFVCGKKFKNKRSLKIHGRQHIKAYEEIKLLQKGYTPDETKIGTKFKGKNKIIIG